MVLDGGKVLRTKVVRVGRCGCGKLAYSSRKLAKATAAVEARSTGEPIYAYKCVRGGHCWHLGHPIGWRRQQRELLERAAIVSRLDDVPLSKRELFMLLDALEGKP